MEFSCPWKECSSLGVSLHKKATCFISYLRIDARINNQSQLHSGLTNLWKSTAPQHSVFKLLKSISTTISLSITNVWCVTGLLITNVICKVSLWHSTSRENFCVMNMDSLRSGWGTHPVNLILPNIRLQINIFTNRALPPKFVLSFPSILKISHLPPPSSHNNF